MTNPRWKKIVRDLSGNLGRSLLIVLSISVGVAAIGCVLGMQDVLSRELPAAFARTNPASAVLTMDPFDDELVQSVRRIPGVAAAEGRHALTVRMRTDHQDMRAVQLQVIPDYAQIQVNRITPQSGAWPPPRHQMLLERSSLALLGIQEGDRLIIQAANGIEREIPVAGLVHDLSQAASSFTNQVTGYITLETLVWLGYPRQFNQLLILADARSTETAWFQQVANQVRDQVEKSGRRVQWTEVRDPNQYWFETYLTPMTAILGAIGMLSILLSCFLVINTINALLAQQVRQIGVMKAIGARGYQLVGLYQVMILLLGVAALALAIPLSILAGRASIQNLSGYINFDPPVYVQPAWVMALQAALSLVIPSLAGIVSILRGTGISVREAIQSTGIENSAFGSGFFDRLVSQVRGLSRPFLLSLRNTFRRKGRLVLTLATLALGSGIFIAVLGVQSSLIRTLDETLNYYRFDILVFFEQPYRTEQILAETQRVPGVSAVETWGMVDSHRVRPDGFEGDSIFLVAPQADTRMIRPWLVAGRWLSPDDENAVVINTDVLLENPDLQVGSDMVLKIEGEEIHWTVVGIVKSVLIGPWAYSNYPYFAYRLNKANRASSAYVITEQHGEDDVASIARQLEAHYGQIGIRVSSTSRVVDLRNVAITQFNVMTAALVIMALLVALVGGLGLSGTMSLNVIERTREIGVMRAVGANHTAILRIVIGEGMLIGFLSWLLGCLLAFPLGSLLGNLVGTGFLQAPLSNAYSVSGALAWLAIVLAISAAASLAPGVVAVRSSVREALAYE